MNNEDLNHNIRFIRNILLCFLFILILFLFRVMSNLLLPLILAALVAMMFLPLIQLLRKWKIPKWLVITIVALFTFFVLFEIVNILSNTVQALVGQQDFFFQQFQLRLEEFLAIINDKISLEMNTDVVKNYLIDLINKDNVTFFATGLAKYLGSLGSSLFIFAIYYILLLAGISEYKEYLTYVGGTKDHLVNTVVVLQKTISTYMGIKTIISLVTGLIVGLICTFFGIRFALFWGFLTFMLNYIPSIGSIIATIPPVFMAFIQFDNFSSVLFLLIILTLIQMLIGNFLEPMIMGDRLRLNTVTVIFGLLFWGFIWGIPGMLISVPLMVIIKVVLEKSETWSLLSRVMASSEWSTTKRRRGIFFRKNNDNQK